MGRKIPEQHAFTYDDHNLLTRRRSATAEDLEARRQGGKPRATPPGYAGDDDNGGPERPLRPPSSAVRYTEYSNGGRVTTRLPSKPTRVLQRTGFHWLVFVGLGMLVMILGWMTIGALGSWWQTQQDDWHYGRPRTYQVDAVVGHGDSAGHPSHFIALNLNRQVLVIELPGGDPSKARIYLGPTLLGDGQDLTPVTLTFEDKDGDGKPDLVIHIGDQEVVFHNDGTRFVAPGH